MLNVQVKVSKRGRPFKEADLRKVTTGALDEESLRVKKLYDGTVSTWKHKPKFTIKKKTTEPQTRTVKTDTRGKAGKIYHFVDGGTKAHVIRPKRAKMLAFKTGGKPKTIPSSLKARSGRPGTIPRFAKEVHHPGSKPRNFTKKIQAESRGRLKRTFERRLKAAAKKRGSRRSK